MKKLIAAIFSPLIIAAMILIGVPANAAGDDGQPLPSDPLEYQIAFYTTMCALTGFAIFCDSPYNQPGRETGTPGGGS